MKKIREDDLRLLLASLYSKSVCNAKVLPKDIIEGYSRIKIRVDSIGIYISDDVNQKSQKDMEQLIANFLLELSNATSFETQNNKMPASSFLKEGSKIGDNIKFVALYDQVKEEQISYNLILSHNYCVFEKEEQKG